MVLTAVVPDHDRVAQQLAWTGMHEPVCMNHEACMVPAVRLFATVKVVAAVRLVSSSTAASSSSQQCTPPKHILHVGDVEVSYSRRGVPAEMLPPRCSRAPSAPIRTTQLVSPPSQSPTQQSEKCRHTKTGVPRIGDPLKL